MLVQTFTASDDVLRQAIEPNIFAAINYDSFTQVCIVSCNKNEARYVCSTQLFTEDNIFKPVTRYVLMTHFASPKAF